MSSRRLLDQAVADLNAEQLEAVRQTSHAVVLAGPGSGKTKTLTTAMARVLIEDVPEPQGAACITYNNECAIELEDRLAKLGVEAGGRVFIGTVHSFALSQVLAPYARCALPELASGFRVATKGERDLAVEEAYRATVNEGGDPQQRWRFAETKRKRDVDRAAPDWLRRNVELVPFIEDYERRLHQQGLIDFEDMPLLALRMIREHPWIRDGLRARFPVLLVDEYQDLGHALHELVLTLCFEAGIRLLAVGDVDQSIYGFAGANPELLRAVSERKDVSTTQLRFNYRSGAKIIGASMAALGEERAYQALEGAEAGAVFLHPVAGDHEDQAAYIANTLIPALRKRGVPLDGIGVLYRNAAMGTLIAAAAMAADLPVVRADTQAFVRRNSRLARFVESCARWAAGGWADADPPFGRLTREAASLVYDGLAGEEERRALQLELIQFLDANKGADQDLHMWLQAFRRDLATPWKVRSRALDAEWSAIDEMIERTGPEATEAGLTLATFSGRIEGSGRLNLSTLHSAKGREFDAVILFGVSEGELPDWRDKRPDQLRDARRLFYVGVTRARRELHLVFREGAPSPWVTELYARAEAS